VLDFTAALYLGLRHGSARLDPWPRLTSGVPAAVAEPHPWGEVSAELARLTGVERATLARSTLHAFFDLFVILAEEGPMQIAFDSGAYAIARWGAERAAGRGVPLAAFAHHDPGALLRTLGRLPWLRPVVVADGFCPGCGRAAPLPAYLEIARRRGGRLVVDDTQGLGVLGESPSARAPLGAGGGGTARRLEVGGPDVILVSSLAKGFGVPAAMVGGGEGDVARFESASATRLHCSPPSFADLHAARRALRVNQAYGDRLRSRLTGLIASFRDGIARLGFTPGPAIFPVQVLQPPRGLAPEALHRRLLGLGVRTLILRPACRPLPSIGFIITARHNAAQITAAVAALARAAGASVRPLAGLGAIP
jgi:8-amino-7-oxononanoate synthase